jgi:raffinose/stachyose/melibiose transport system permease protein
MTSKVGSAAGQVSVSPVHGTNVAIDRSRLKNGLLVDSAERDLPPNGQPPKLIWTWLTAYTFLLPALALFIFFELFSLIYNVYVGFQSWSGFGTPKFIGLDNYTELLSDSMFWSAFSHNMIFMAVALVVMTPLSLFIAIVLDSEIPGAAFFRALLFLPVIVPTIVVGLVWTRIFSTQGGLLNQALEAIGLTSLQHDWLGDPQTALGAVLVVWIWRHLGYGVVMFSAALLSIPSELKDASVLDGATPYQTVMQVIIPLLRPVVLIVGIWFAILAFKVFALTYIMTDGGPFHATEVLNTYMYKRVFLFFEMGIGSAVTNIVLLVLLGLSVLRSRFNATYEY